MNGRERAKVKPVIRSVEHFGRNLVAKRSNPKTNSLMSTGKFEIKKDAKGEYRFNLKAGNGQVILSSEGYTAKDGCLNGVESVRKNAADKARFEVKMASNGKHHFNLKSSNGQVVGSSQLYADTSGLENGIQSVMTNAPEAVVEEV
jgi:uncharacterized protein YegP (UPF0339 family)